MNLIDKPELTVEVMSYPEVNSGSKQMVRIRVRGWGRLSIKNVELPFHAYFFEETEWALLLPKGPSVEIEVRNLFGTSVSVLNEPLPRPFLTGQEFFANLEPQIKKIRAPIIKAFARPAIEAVRLQINAHRISLNGALRIPLIKIFFSGNVIKLPKTAIHDNIRMTYSKKQIPLTIKANGLGLSDVFDKINEEIQREHR